MAFGNPLSIITSVGKRVRRLLIYVMSIKMNIQKYKDVKVLIDHIFKEKYNLALFHSESLLRYLEDCLKNAVGKNDELELLSDMVFHSITHVEGLENSVHIFTTEFVKLAFTYRVSVIKSAEMNMFLTQCLQIFKEENIGIQQHLSIIDLMQCLIQSRLGVTWLVEHKVWEHIPLKHYHRKWKKVAEASYHLISDIVWKVDENDDEKDLIEVLDFFINPLIHNEYMNVETLDTDGEEELIIVDTILPFLQTILTVLRDIDKKAKINQIMFILTKKYVVECHMYLLADLSNNYDLVNRITEILYRIWSYNLQQHLKEQSDYDITFELTTLQNNFLYNLIQTKERMFVLNSLMTMNLLWFKINKTNISCLYKWNGKQYNIEIQLISLILMPLLIYVDNNSHVDYEDIRCKLEKVLSEHTIKLAYAYRGPANSNNNIKKLVINALKQYTRLVDLITNAQAGIMYEALHYILEIYAHRSNPDDVLRIKHKKIEIIDLKNSLEDVQILNVTLDLVKNILLKHDINWYENVEITRLQNILVNLLKCKDLATKQIMQILDVIEICVGKFLLPDLSLLIESHKGSVLQELGQLMSALIKHDAWEIRDSTLSLLLICIEISFVKYVPMRKIIKDNNLMNPVVDLALHDDEMYVQANALKCLAATTTIGSFWHSILTKHTNLIEDIIKIVSTYHESLVRKEAANVLMKIYVNQQMNESFNLKMYRLMAKVAIEDLQWEVQLVALNFWQHMIQNELNDRGMIDGIFPAVTFCKVKHKIVVLNDTEIHKKLSNVMYRLSYCGGLAVLNECMKKDHHVQVIEKVNTIARNLVEILTKYNFKTDEFQDTLDDPGNEREDKSPIKEGGVVQDNDIIIQKDNQDTIIDDILNMSFSELTINLNSNKSNDDVEIENTQDFRKPMSVVDFLRSFHKNDTSSRELIPTLNSENEQLEALKKYLFNDNISNYSMECV